MLQHHLAKFQNRIPFIFQPGVVFHSRIIISWAFPLVFSRIWQTKILQLFGKRSSVMFPIYLRTQFGIFLQTQIIIQLRSHHIKIAAFQHRKINQALVLCRHGSTSPIAKIRGEIQILVGKNRIYGEQSTIELGRVFSVSIAAQHITKQLIILTHLVNRIRFAFPFFGINKRAIPEVMPP